MKSLKFCLIIICLGLYQVSRPEPCFEVTKKALTGGEEKKSVDWFWMCFVNLTQQLISLLLLYLRTLFFSSSSFFILFDKCTIM